jgi:hypothetical protein
MSGGARKSAGLGDQPLAEAFGKISLHGRLLVSLPEDDAIEVREMRPVIGEGIDDIAAPSVEGEGQLPNGGRNAIDTYLREDLWLLSAAPSLTRLALASAMTQAAPPYRL